MFDELKTYGIISVLLILVLGYFVYIIYRDNIVLKNNIKELKETLLMDIEEDVYSEDEYREEEHDHHNKKTQITDVIYTDLDDYFSHVTPVKLSTVQELEEPENEETEHKVEVTKEQPKKSKGRKAKKTESTEEELI